jgi:hypothetical protein
MKHNIKTAIIVDPNGTYTGPTAEEEIKEHIKTFSKVVKPAILKPYTCHSAGSIADGTDLVVYDFGGMMPGTSLMEDNARYLIRWAENHSDALIVVVSTFTYRNYVAVEMEDNGLTLPNIVLDDGKQELILVLPDWWKYRFGIKTPELSKRVATEIADEIADLEADRALAEQDRLETEEKLRKNEENKLLREKLRQPVAYITLPVACEGVSAGSIAHGWAPIGSHHVKLPLMKQITIEMFSLGPRKGVEARIYSESGNGTYFRGSGRTDAEALGSLICSYGLERLGLKVEIVQDPDENKN